MEKKQKISSRQRKEEDRAILKKLINTRNEAPTRRSRKTAKNKIKEDSKEQDQEASRKMKKQRNYQETHLGSCNRVSVGKEFKGSCSIERCKCRIVVHVFIDDGQPKSSRYWGSYCRKHLSIGIKSGWIKNDVVYKKLRRQDYSRDY